MYYYVVPTVEAPGVFGNYIGPKYFEHLPANISGIKPVTMQTIQYGDEPYCIVAADITSAQHTSLIANNDVRYLTNDLTAKLSGVAQIKTALGKVNIPSAWVNTSLTWGQFLKRLSVYMLFFQMLKRETGIRKVFTGKTLNDTVTAGMVTAWNDILGVTITTSTTIGDALDAAYTALSNLDVYVGGNLL